MKIKHIIAYYMVEASFRVVVDDECFDDDLEIKPDVSLWNKFKYEISWYLYSHGCNLYG